jgi:thioredoxin-related protein
MKTNSILILALVLIVIVVLFNNNKQEPFQGEQNIVNELEVDIENIVHDLEVILCLLTYCPHCHKLKKENATDEQVREMLGIPANIKITRAEAGGGDAAAQAVFTKFGVNSAPTAVLHHPGTGLHQKTHASKEAIAKAAGEVVEKVKNHLTKAR